MVVSIFSISNKNDKERFFEKNILLANVKLDIVFRMPFLTMTKTDVDFQAWNL